MRFLTTLSFAVLSASAALAAEEVKVEITRAVECERKSQKGDKIAVHYRGTLQSDGSEFDASYKRGQPLSFVVGKGSVIKGWDDNLIDMCIGEKRTLTIPPEFGYGSRAMGPIPASSTLIFETELMAIDGVKAPEKIIEKPASSASSVASDASEGASSVASGASESASSKGSSIASEATEGVAGAAASIVAGAAEVINVLITDSDGDGQEHNEL